MSVAGIVLAAGASRRLGSAKQLALLGGRTLLERVVDTAIEAGLRPVYVVVAPGAKYEWKDCQAARVGALAELPVVLVENSEAAEGMATSVRAGVMAAGDADGVVILACDQPAVTAVHLRALSEGGNAVVASAYAGRKGVPAYFPARAFGELLTLRGDVGARELLKDARSIELLGGELDVDTVEDLELAVRLYGRPVGL